MSDQKRSSAAANDNFSINSNVEPLSRLLIVDDEKDMCIMLQKVLHRKCNCQIELAGSGEEALELLKTWRPNVILTDLKMTGIDGLDLLRLGKKYDPDLAVIMMTGHASIDSAVSALKEGAYDFFEKPVDNDLVIRAVQRTLERATLLRENRLLHNKLTGRTPFHGFVGRSPSLYKIFNLINKIAKTDVTVLIRGESGTGKELAAKTIHLLSNRSQKELVTVNCPALPEQILESELFGYARGAFTGANQEKPGLFAEANNSTIMLDEIGDMPISLQIKLLRVLQEKTIQPLGQNKCINVDVRIISSTHQNLEKKINQGTFREDLFYRLNVVTITMPPLRERPEDIPIMAEHFLKTYSKEYQRQDLKLSAEAIKHLMQHNWPGNVRELQNCVNRAVLLSNGPIIKPDDLSYDEGAKKDNTINGDLNKQLYNNAKEQMLNNFSIKYLSQVLEAKEGNVTAAAQASGLGRQSFQRLLKRYGLDSSTFRTPKR